MSKRYVIADCLGQLVCAKCGSPIVMTFANPTFREPIARRYHHIIPSRVEYEYLFEDSGAGGWLIDGQMDSDHEAVYLNMLAPKNDSRYSVLWYKKGDRVMWKGKCGTVTRVDPKGCDYGFMVYVKLDDGTEMRTIPGLDPMWGSRG
jgi:hypothetical protein